MVASVYETEVDPFAPNNPHAFLIDMAGGGGRVLELGAAAGSVTKVLAERHTHVTAVEYDSDAAESIKQYTDDVVVADLNDPGWVDLVEAGYDVVTAGDVLEHLLHPERVLSEAMSLLRPGGIAVVSLPHIAHADVRLALVEGRFPYGPWGLLDETHIRFFTLSHIARMVSNVGGVITEMRRVRVPMFESELGVERSRHSVELINEILRDPEAETYQFVFTIVRDSGDARLRRAAESAVELAAEVERLRRSAVSSESLATQVDHLQRESSSAAAEVERLRAEGDELGRRAQWAEAEIQALYRTRAMRMSIAAMSVYRRLKGGRA